MRRSSSCNCLSGAKQHHAGGAEDAPIYARIGAALVTSAIGITVANPSDVVKVRQQACSIRADAHGDYFICIL